MTHPLSENGDNYFTWRRNFLNALHSKNKASFVNGAIKKPDANSSDFQPWMQCNALVLSWLTNALAKELQDHVVHAETTQELWQDLEERFTQGVAPRVYELKRAIALLQQEKSSISSYYGNLKAVWGELQGLSPVPVCTCGCVCGAARKMQDMREEEKVFDFLMGLDEAYTTVRSQILSVSPLPNLGRAYAIAAQEEKQRLVAANRTPNIAEAAALLSKKSEIPSKKNHDGGRVQFPPCMHCGKTNHSKEFCYKVVGYPTDWRQPGRRSNKQDKQYNGDKLQSGGSSGAALATTANDSGITIPGLTSEQYQQLLTLLSGQNTASGNPSANMAVSNFSGKTKDAWVIDTGATHHITHDIDSLSNVVSCPDMPPVQISNGDTVGVNALGRITLSKRLILEQVLGISNFCFNLLSVSKLTRDLNCSLTFWSGFFVIQDLHSRKLIGVGREQNGLYYLEPMKGGKALMTKHSGTASLWHRRLGHLPMNRIPLVPSLSISDCDKTFACDACYKAKQTRSPFPISTNKTMHAFDLLHCDIWGPYKTASYSGSHYFLTIVDDFSRATWVFLMKYKSDTKTYLLQFFHWVNTQFDSQIKIIRTDNGSEFIHKDLMSYYSDHGMEHQTSCVYTPQQNGIVERKHRHLLEVARALMFQANLPISFWGESILTAAYLINRMPLSVLQDRTPHEVLLGKTPMYDHLRTFGCLCYGHVNGKPRDKFAARAKPGVFVGYPHNTKGYKVYDLESKGIYVSRDVDFLEDIFPFAQIPVGDSIDQTQMTSRSPFTQVELIHDTYEPHQTFSDSQNSTMIEGLGSKSTGDDHEASSSIPNDSLEQNSNPIATLPPAVLPNKRHRQVSRLLSGYNYTLPPSLAPTDSQSLSTTPSANSTVYPLSHFISYSKFSPDHTVFLSAISSTDEPKSFSQAVRYTHWREAVAKEITALEANHTWTLQPLPPGKRAIDSKWVYKIKYQPDGSIERYKARLVAKGFTQIEGVDFHETFAPVTKLVTIRCLLAVASIKHCEIHQLDVNNAFLHGDLEEEVYMKIPQGVC